MARHRVKFSCVNCPHIRNGCSEDCQRLDDYFTYKQPQGGVYILPLKKSKPKTQERTLSEEGLEKWIEVAVSHQADELLFPCLTRTENQLLKYAYYEQLNNNEIARKLSGKNNSINARKVVRRLARAVKKLKKYYKDNPEVIKELGVLREAHVERDYQKQRRKQNQERNQKSNDRWRDWDSIEAEMQPVVHSKNPIRQFFANQDVADVYLEQIADAKWKCVRREYGHKWLTRIPPSDGDDDPEE